MHQLPAGCEFVVVTRVQLDRLIRRCTDRFYSFKRILTSSSELEDQAKVSWTCELVDKSHYSCIYASKKKLHNREQTNILGFSVKSIDQLGKSTNFHVAICVLLCSPHVSLRQQKQPTFQFVRRQLQVQSLYSLACNTTVLKLVKCSTTVLKYVDTLQNGPDYISRYAYSSVWCHVSIQQKHRPTCQYSEREKIAK